MVKTELHTHTSDDPHDRIPHSAFQLIDRAVTLGYGALAITLHDRQLDVRDLSHYASDRGLVLIPGIEQTIEGKHVLLLNFSPAAEDVRSFQDLADLRRRENGLVIAPHPFFPAPSCLRSRMDRHADLFDAVEWNAMFTRLANFNARAARWAAAHGKTLVANCDVHRLYQLGTCYSMVDAPPEPAAICDAVRRGRVTIRAEPLSVVMAGITVADLALARFTVRHGAAVMPAQS